MAPRKNAWFAKTKIKGKSKNPSKSGKPGKTAGRMYSNNPKRYIKRADFAKFTEEQIEARHSANIIIGIDPGQHTGVAIWDRKRQEFLLLQTGNFWDAIEQLKYCAEHNDMIYVRIEDPNLNRPIFWDEKKGLKGFNTKTKLAQNVGMNKRDAQLLIEFCKKERIQFEAVQPTTSKLSAQDFRQLTGYTERTNEHSRDAGKLVYKF